MNIPSTLTKKLYRITQNADWTAIIQLCATERERERNILETTRTEKEDEKSRGRIEVMKEIVGLAEKIRKVVDKTTPKGVSGE